ncbi:MAG: 3'-5' exonuclease, partial [Terriglobales bacterium]
SIYGFRNAQVGLFQQVLRTGRLGPVPLEFVALSRNFRSQPELVTWTNSIFGAAAAQADLADFFAAADSAVVPRVGAKVELHAPGSPETEAAAIAQIVQATPGKTAILVFNRNHLGTILPELTRHGAGAEGVKLRSLAESAAVRDLLALTRALARPADRIAWLAVLRAPWCGLRLASLHLLCGDDSSHSIPSLAGDARRRATLPDDERQRLEAVLPVLEAAVQEHGRIRLRRLAGWCWRQLEPTPTSERESEAAAYLDHLEKWEERGGGELEELAEGLKRLAAPAEAAGRDAVQIMTIHEAKGREFDTVIVPSLHRHPRDIGSDLLRWDSAAGLVAAVQATGHSDDAHYKFAGDRLRQLAEKEQLRLLYVAATRARHALHLFGDIKPARGDRDPHPDRNAPLARIWSQVRDQWPAPNIAAAPPPDDEAPPTPPKLVRVRAVAPAPESPPAPPTLASGREASYQPDLPRRVGEAVHAVLQRLAQTGLSTWIPAELEAELRRDGVAPLEMAAAKARAARALDATLNDPRGHWILARHVDDHCEWELTCAKGDYKLDRSFVDAGIRWVIDFKTAAPDAGEDHIAFRARQVERHQAQLRIYADLVRALDPALPVRCALYLPMLEAGERWIEVADQ